MDKLTDSIGVITIDDDMRLWYVTAHVDGLLWLRPMSGPWSTRVILPDQFWPLLDRMP